MNRRLEIYTTATHIVAVAGGTDFLVVERATGRVRNSAPEVSYQSGAKVYAIAILGIVKEEKSAALVLATDAKAVAIVRNCPIYALTSVRTLPVSLESDPSSKLFAGVAKVTSTQLFTLGCYFSPTYDLTRPFQHSGMCADMHQSADERFYWNREMYVDFEDVPHVWLVPVIQGFVGAFDAGTSSDPIQVTVISRRSVHMAGTRYNARGIDDDGNVANFVESEQVLFFRGSYFYFLQVRGSVPIFWQQTGAITAPIALSRSEDSAAPAFLKHFDFLTANYRNVLIVNLLAKKRGEELLTRAYNALCDKFRSQLGSAVYRVEFDYQKECKHERHCNIRSLLEQTHDILTFYGFGAVGALSCEQKGVPRINCLDCLDRTNVVMARFAWDTLVQQFSVVQVPLVMDYDAVKDNPLLKLFKNLWANNGDMLSKQYTGVGSVASVVTRKGKKGLSGMLSHGLKTVGRIISAADSRNQANIDIVLGNSSPRGVEPEDSHAITVRVCSWDLMGEHEPLQEDLLRVLTDDALPKPQIVVLGLQEVTTSVLAGHSHTVLENWSDRVCRLLSRQGTIYRWVHSTESMGCALLLFAHEELIPMITAVETDTVKRKGLKRALCRRGIILLRLTVLDVPICFLNCHLPGGLARQEERLALLAKAHEKGFHKKRKVPKVTEHTAKFLFGNLNFRVFEEASTILSRLSDNNFSELLQRDELRQFLSSKDPLRSYSEGSIAFRPTYKYSRKSHFYDQTKSNRSPAWSDRILYSGEGLQQISYSSVDSLHSQHRPVTASFLLVTRPGDLDRSR